MRPNGFCGCPPTDSVVLTRAGDDESKGEGLGLPISLKVGLADAAKEAILDGLMLVDRTCEGVRVRDAVALGVTDRVTDTLLVRVCERV